MSGLPRLCAECFKRPVACIPRQIGRQIHRQTAARHLKLSKSSISRLYSQAGYRPKVGHLVSLLGLGAVSATSYGLWLYYQTFKTWPTAVRTPLRAAVRAQEQGAFEYAERFYKEALEAAKESPETGPESLGSDRELKISGIAVALAGLLEQSHKIGPAYEVYTASFENIQDKAEDGKLLLRAVGIAQKIGELATALGTPDTLAHAEEHLGWAVTHLLKAASNEGQRVIAADRTSRGETGLELQDLSLPDWMSALDLGATMESLANFYLAQNNGEYAISLYTQVLKILLPKKAPGVPTPSYADRCHAGTISNNISSAYALHPSTRNIATATQWAQNAVHIATHTMQDAERERKTDETTECGPCLAVGQFNLGLLKEMSNAPAEATELFNKSLATSRSIKFVEGARQAAAALQRVRSTSS